MSLIEEKNWKISIDGNNSIYIELGMANLTMSDDFPIRYAARKGNTRIFKMLLDNKIVNPTTLDNEAIRMASKYGYTEIVQLLLNDPRVDPADDWNACIREASINGHLEIVQLLLNDPRVDPSELDNFAIIRTYKLDPTKFTNYDWEIVLSEKLDKIVALLFKDKRVRNMLRNNNIDLYQELNSKFIKNTICEF
jgi:ankyrin repeat protein